MTKRKNIACFTAPGKELNSYLKSYKGGGRKDIHMKVFEEVQTMTKAQRVLYPGAHRHLTTSLVFPHVTYLDYDKKVAELYKDEKAREYIDLNKIYDQESEFDFHICNVLQERHLSDELKEKDQYDLLISLSAGVIAASCTKYIKQGGHLLVNDSHSDARSIFALNSNDWQLISYWKDNSFCNGDIDDCFYILPKKKRRIVDKVEPRPISKKEVEESISQGTVSKRSFHMIKDSSFYIFRKI